MEEQKKYWYVIHTYSGYEDRVKINLEHRIQNMDVKDKILQVVIPTEEEIEIKRLSTSRKEPMGIHWLKRFNEEGIAGLMDAERTGRPATYSQEIRSNLLDLALQKPRSLGYPFELWTLERLQRAFKERHGVHLSDSTIWTWVEAEGFRWRKQESWFHEPEKHDPEFVQKKGLIVAA